MHQVAAAGGNPSGHLRASSQQQDSLEVLGSETVSTVSARILRRGYRCGGDYKQCLKSAFTLHTETINAWVSLLNLQLMLHTNDAALECMPCHTVAAP